MIMKIMLIQMANKILFRQDPLFLGMQINLKSTLCSLISSFDNLSKRVYTALTKNVQYFPRTLLEVESWILSHGYYPGWEECKE